MIYFSPSYLFTTLAWGLGLSNALPKGQNTNNHGITKAGNDLSKLITASALVQDPSVTSKYSKEQIKAILKAASSKDSDDVIKQLMLDAGYSYTRDNETPVNGENPEYLFKKPDANNPDTVLHRSARAEEGMGHEQKLDLGNNCFIIGLSKKKLARHNLGYYLC